MADKRKALVKITSPKLVFRFPKISEPDYGTKDFPKPDGEYSVQGIIQLDSPEAKAFLARLQPHYDEAVAAGQQAYSELKLEARKKLDKQGGMKVNDLYTTLYDKDTEEPTGEICFKFAMKASGELKKGPKAGTRWERKPSVFDARANLLTKVPSIWGGTVGKVSFECSPYFIPGTGTAGMKLSLLGVQIIDLVSGGQRTAKDLGFGEEDGWENAADEETAEGSATSTETTAGAEEDADF